MGGIIPSPNYITGDVTITGGNVRMATAGKGAVLNLGGVMYTAFNSAANDIAIGSIAQPGNMFFYGGNGKACQFYTNFVMTAEFKGGNTATAGLYLRGETQGIYSHQQASKAWARVDAVTPSFVGYGVASVTDMGAGHTRVTFTTPFADANYAAVALHNNMSTVRVTGINTATDYVDVHTGTTDGVPFAVVVYR